MLHDGTTGFWLIDHGQAIEAGQRFDALASKNVLFTVARENADHVEVESKLRPGMESAMQAFCAVRSRSIQDSIGVRIGEIDELLAWLENRQPYLLRFVEQRLPNNQQDMFK